jgi:hypothetical protein
MARASTAIAKLILSLVRIHKAPENTQFSGILCINRAGSAACGIAQRMLNPLASGPCALNNSARMFG